MASELKPSARIRYALWRTHRSLARNDLDRAAARCMVALYHTRHGPSHDQALALFRKIQEQAKPTAIQIHASPGTVVTLPVPPGDSPEGAFDYATELAVGRRTFVFVQTVGGGVTINHKGRRRWHDFQWPEAILDVRRPVSRPDQEVM